MECSTKLSCNKTRNSMSDSGFARRTALAQEEAEQSLDSPEILAVAGAADVSKEPIVDESEGNLGRKAVKKTRATKAEYWVAFEEYMDENNNRRAKCKYCPKSYACDSNKNGTKNVKNHFESCAQNPANMGKGTQSQIILENMSDTSSRMRNWSYDANALREAIVEMVIRDEMSFTSVEKDGLKNAFFVASPQFKMPSRFTIQRDCFKLYTKEREKMKEVFRNSCQRVCLTTDCWTSLQMVNYMCVTAHFVDSDWKLQKKIINFCKISSHRGYDIGKTLEDCLNYWNLDKKLLTVTVDNASANDVACSYMSEMAEVKDCITKGKYMHMRCMAHILNLIVQDGIKQCGEHVDKLRAVIKYVRGSPARLHSFKQLAEKFKVDCNLSLRLDVCTRWNSTYQMLVSAIPYKIVLSRMEVPHLDDSDLGPLSATDWSKIEVLASYLKEFYDLTVRISGSLYLTSNFMILYISKVVNVLNKLAANDDPTLKKMATEMKKKCDKYWGSFDKLNMLIFVPTILDPFYKLRGVSIALQMMFSQENEDYMLLKVKEAAYEVFDLYVSSYSVSESHDTSSLSNPSIAGEKESSSFLQEINEKMTRGNTDRDDISDRSEFDLYLHERNEAEAGDVLRWWKLNGPRYPILSRMARDVLAIPITTVPSESTFSTGGRHLTSYRSRLKPKIVQALVCTQDWLRLRTRTNNSNENSDSDSNENDSEEDEDDEGTFYVA